MRIVHVAEDFSSTNTGITSSVRELALASIAAGHEVALVAPGDVGNIGGGSLPIQTTSCNGMGARWRYSSRFSEQLTAAAGRGTIVHVHGLWMYPQWTAIRLARERGWPVVLTPHNMLGGWLWRRGWGRRLKKQVYFELMLKRQISAVSAVHGLSDLECTELRKNFFPKSRIVQIPNAVDLASIDFELGHDCAVSPGPDRYILFFGRLHPVKGIELLLEAFSTFSSANQVRLIIAGPCSVPRYEEELKNKTRSFGLEQSVVFFGPVYGAEKWRLLAGAWALCAPSFSEGISMAALEAMAASVPVITTKGAGLGDVGAAGGMLVGSDSAEIANALARTFEWNYEERLARGSMARKNIEANYSWSAVWPMYESLYESVLN